MLKCLNAKMLKCFVVFIFVFSAINLIFYYYYINYPSNNDKDVKFTVSNGEGVKQIAQKLSDANLIKSKFYFEIYIWQNNFESKLQAGDYILNSLMSVKKIAEIFTSGKTISKERTIKIIEGWDIQNIGEYFEKENIISKKEFINQITNDELRMMNYEFLKNRPKNANLEGYLFPDTYKIFQNAKVSDIVQKMLDNFDKKLSKEMREDIAKQGKTIHEIITMASVIEKEVRTEEDMKIVSGIFWNRIKNNQSLESCATLAYILGINKQQYSEEDTKIDSPYNTYKNTGLPLGPICNPGLKAIKAAIYPKFTDYNYFLNKQDTGETVFSVDFKEHIKNKQKYLK